MESCCELCKQVCKYLYLKGFLCLLTDWLGDEVDLVFVSTSVEPVRHEITLLLDKTFVAVLSLTKSITAVSVCFDIKQSVRNTDIVQSGLVKVVRRSHKFIFTLLSNGVVRILLLPLILQSEIEKRNN